MIMEPSITRTEHFSGALKSFLQQLRGKLTSSGTSVCSASDWEAFLSDVRQQDAALSEEARERRAAIVQIIRSADVSAKMSIADSLLFADDVDAAHDAIMQRRAA